jgi:Leucine-rich repeat (LRR) protein
MSNQISSIESGGFTGLPNLQWLHLYWNQISSIEPGGFSGLGTLQTLGLLFNQISSIESGDVAGLTNLQFLVLGHNQISSIESNDFAGVTNLQRLDLDSNHISSIESGDFTGLRNLQRLDLGGNRITSIESGGFAGLTNLQELDLHSNQINNIESGSFSGLANLQELNLSYNLFTHLNLSGAHFLDLQSFRVMPTCMYPITTITSVDMSEASLSDLAFETLIDEFEEGDIGTIDLSAADLSAVVDLSPMYGLSYLVTLDMPFTELADANQVGDLVLALEPWALDNLTLSWDQWWLMEGTTRTALTDWDALPANTLTIIPEPASCVLLTCALAALALLCRHRNV